MLTISEARQVTEETIQFGLRHADYDRCTEIARKSRIFVTGEGQDDEYLMNLRDKETARQKQIRVKVTKPITPFALTPVKTQFQKMFRVDGVVKNIESADKEGLALINNATDTYNANAGLTHYLERRYLHWQFLDPNGWHITERRNVLDETSKILRIDTYPLEVTSEQAVNYHFDNGVPVWLIVEQKRTEVVRLIVKGVLETTENEVSDFYFYGSGVALKYAEFLGETTELEGVEIVPLEQEGKEARQFILSIYETGSREFPGNKWGAYDCPEGDGTVKIPPFWEGARFILEDLIQGKSIFDVSRYNHVFPKLFHYDYPCNYQNGNGSKCLGGYLDEGKNHICPSCNGTGGKIHVSESDIITFAIPENMEDFDKLPPLSNLAYYHEPPLAVTQELYKWLNDFREWVYLASFNTSNVVKAVVPRTATEIDNLTDEINTRVYPCATWLSRLFEKTVRVTAQYLGKDKDLVVKHAFPAGMKLEGLDVLIDRFKRARDAGMSYEVTWEIHCSILGKTYLDTPQKVELIKAWEYWKPFKSFDENLTLLILQSRANDDYDKLLYENWDTVRILVDTELSGKIPFSELSKDKQFLLIQSAVQKVSENIRLLGAEAEQLPDLTEGGMDEDEEGEIGVAAVESGGGI